jgi:hypothetical protein
MARAKVDWSHHLDQFRESSLSVAEYCASAGLRRDAFQYHLNKSKTKRRPTKSFTEYAVATELVITRDSRGSLTLSGFDLSQLPAVVGAWSHALSQ